jgi:hypothetical protein
MVRYETPQPGNPHKLTIRQHLLPRKTIERFCGPDGRVHIQFVQTSKVARHRPNSELFCAMRAWDQKAEACLGKSIEDAFQAIAERLCAGTLDSLSPDMHAPVTEMYLLWRHRCLRARNPLPDLKVVGITGDPTLDRDRQERLEAGGVMFVKPDGTWPGRMMAGISLRRDIDLDWMGGAHAMRWRIWGARDSEFLVPDAFIDQPVLPVSPTICLVSTDADAMLELPQVARLNRAAVEASNRYWFSRSPDRCPILRATSNQF